MPKPVIEWTGAGPGDAAGERDGVRAQVVLGRPRRQLATDGQVLTRPLPQGRDVPLGGVRPADRVALASDQDDRAVRPDRAAERHRRRAGRHEHRAEALGVLEGQRVRAVRLRGRERAASVEHGEAGREDEVVGADLQPLGGRHDDAVAVASRTVDAVAETEGHALLVRLPRQCCRVLQRVDLDLVVEDDGAVAGDAARHLADPSRRQAGTTGGRVLGPDGGDL
ncbi:MAG: hypothetical protein PGN07_01920 [Aeromicrobium erythreum]